MLCGIKVPIKRGGRSLPNSWPHCQDITLHQKCEHFGFPHFFPLFFEVLTRPFSDHLDISAPPKRSAKASRHALVQSPGSLQFSTADGRVPPFSAAFRSLKGTPLALYPLLWDCLPRGLVLLVLGLSLVKKGFPGLPHFFKLYTLVCL